MRKIKKVFVRFLLDIIYFLLMLVYLPMAVYRCIVHKRYRNGWKQRFGAVNRKYPNKKCILLHAVSLGEINAAKTVIEELSKTNSDYEIIISTTTDTGMARGQSLYGDKLSVIYFPFDFSFISKKLFQRLKPDMILLVELEIWPNLVFNAHKNNIPIIVINGRLSDKSFPKYKKFGMLIKPIFEKLTLGLVQTQEYAQRFIELGCPQERVIITGSLKYDTSQVCDKIAGAEQIAEQLKIAGQQLIVAGGTGDGEEKIMMDCFKKLKSDLQNFNIRLAIVPRKPERFGDAAKLITESGFVFDKFSEYKTDSTKKAQRDDTVILVDTMGDLRKFYSLATVNFVGRSMVNMGGSDMIESAAMGKFTIFGKYTFNFRQSAQDLLKNNGAVKVEDQIQLYNTIKRALTDPIYRNTIADKGRDVIIKNKGATKKTIENISKYLVN